MKITKITMKSFIRTCKIYLLSFLYNREASSEQKLEESEVVIDSMSSQKESRSWSDSERIVAAYISLHGLKGTDLTREDVAYVLGRTKCALDRKISRLRRYEKSGDRLSITNKELYIMNRVLGCREDAELKRYLSQNLFISGIDSQRQDNQRIQNTINNMFASSFRKKD